MDAPVRWGIVGFGWVARDYMVPAIREAGHALVAVCDPDPAARARADRLGAAVYLDVEGLAGDPAVEAVYVATPNHLHRQAVEALAARGKAVLCEKPMASTLVDAAAMVQACRAADVLYGTAFDQRHHPVHRALRGAIEAGMLGTVTTVRIVYACWLGADWNKGTGGNWRIDAAQAGGGATIDLAPHGLDLVDFLLGEPIIELRVLMQRRVQDYPVDDGGVLVGQTASGVLASLHVSYNCPEGLPRRRLEVLGTKGQLTATDSMGQDAGGTLLFIDGQSGEIAPVPVPNAGASPFANQVLAFSDALRTGRHAAFSMERDLHTMRLIDEAYRADKARAGHLPDMARRRVAVPTPLF